MSKTEDLRHWGEAPEAKTLPFFTLKETEVYEIDFDKVETLDDVINVLMGLNIKFISAKEDIIPYMRKYLKESDKE